MTSGWQFEYMHGKKAELIQKKDWHALEFLLKTPIYRHISLLQNLESHKKDQRIVTVFHYAAFTMSDYFVNSPFVSRFASLTQNSIELGRTVYL